VWRPSDLRRLASLTRDERRVLAAAGLLLPLYALRVRLFGLRRTLAAMPAVAADVGAASPQGLARLVSIASRRGPYRAACLPASLALRHLLANRGIASDLRLGVSAAGGELEAHAWVECRGVVILDLRGRDREFAPFDRAIAPPRP
jgi:hypothetical protein